jgi:hypothetical protein
MRTCWSMRFGMFHANGWLACKAPSNPRLA